MSDETEAEIQAAIAKYTRSNLTFILLILGQTVAVSAFIFQIYFKTNANEARIDDIKEDYRRYITITEERNNALIRISVATDRTTADIAELKASIKGLEPGMRALERTVTLFEQYMKTNPSQVVP